MSSKIQVRKRTLKLMRWLGLALLTATLVVALILIWHNPESGPDNPITGMTGQSPEIEQLMQLGAPFTFVENKGQWDTRAKFVAQNGNMTTWIEQHAITLRLEKQGINDKNKGVVTQLTFAGASPTVLLEGEKPQGATRSFFKGNDRSKWHSGVTGYAQVLYHGLYPGIDLRLRQHEGRLEYDLLLRPGADLEQVVIQCTGTDGLELEPDGSLLINTPLGPIRQRIPLTWYEHPSGEKEPAVCNYVLLDEKRFSFSIADLNPALALVIDPGLEWSTFVGGMGVETGSLNNLAIAENGEVLLVGATGSTDFPTTVGAYDTSNAGDLDVFVSRWDPNAQAASQLIWSTLVGGASADGAGFRGTAVAVDAAGNIIVAGTTASTDFPTTPSAYDTTYNGGAADGFVLQLNASGTTLLQSTFLGGSGHELLADVGVDDNGVSVLGLTFSSDFPTTPDAFDTSANGGQDLVLARLDFNQSGDAQLVWSTFVGGSGDEDGLFSDGPSLDVRPNGNIVFGGGTRSRDFPTTPGAFRENYIGGPDDGFVAELDVRKSGNEQLIYSTYFGGISEDIVTEVVLADQGQVVVGGSTRSVDLPTTPDAYISSQSAGLGVLGPSPYVAWLDLRAPGDAQLIYSTYLANTGFLFGLTIDGTGAAIAVGLAFNDGFSTTPDAHQPRYAGGFDAIALRLDRHLTGEEQLTYATFLGGTLRDVASDVVVDGAGNWIISGETASAGFPVTSGAFDDRYETNDPVEAFLVKINPPAKIPDAKRRTASLTGKQLVPPVDTAGQGFGRFVLNGDSTELKYDLAWAALSADVKTIRFHLAPAGSNGPVVATVFEGTLPRQTVTLAGVWRAGDAEPFTPALVTALCEEGLNITITTEVFPDGEIRGQIVSDPLAKIALAQPGIFYAGIGGHSGAAGENRGEALTIDPASGAATLLGGPGLGQAIPALSIDTQGRIFIGLTESRFSPVNLYQLDAESGQAVLLGPDLDDSEAMAFDLSNNLYYAGLQDGLKRVDMETGAVERVGPLGFVVRGMAFDPTDNTLWASTGGPRPSDTIFTIDLLTGQATRVGETGFGAATPDIAFDEDGNLFGVKGGGQRPNDLITIDKETGAGTLVGPIGFNAVSALAMKTPPKPGPQLGLNARTINFRAVRVGDSATRQIVLSNFGTQDLIITAIADPGEPFAFAELPALPLVLAPGESEKFEAQFSATTRGVANARITITSNDVEEAIFERALVAKGVELDDMALAVPGTVYASTGRQDGARMLTINPQTGEGTLLGLTGLIRLPALAINSKGEIFASDGGLGFRENLYRIDARDGAAVVAAPLGDRSFSRLDALAFDSKDVLYAIDTFILLRIDAATGASTEIVRYPGVQLAGMAFDPTDNKLWVSTGRSSDLIFTVDVATGDTVHIGETGLGGGTPDLFFDELGNLYGVKGGGRDPQGQGGEPDPSTLIRIDKSTGAGTVIGSVGAVGFTSVSGMAAFRYRPIVDAIEDPAADVPVQFALAQNYPNPFNPSTVIRYDLPRSTKVKLAIYDILGRVVRTLVDGHETAGTRQVTWDGHNDTGLRVATGLYFYRIEAGDFVKTRKLMMIK